MTESNRRVAGLLLAAGGSKRLGRPKQLVELDGKSLIVRAAEALIGAGCSPVVVVLGSEVEGSTAALAGLDLEIVINDEWESGMSSSIRAGMRSIPDADAMLISLVDHPLVSSEDLRKLLAAFKEPGATIVASGYSGVSGVPALFSSVLFDVLKKLDGDKGARSVIQDSPDVVTIELPNAAVDIDAASDLERLQSFLH
jgi:CTP:molybdopterin cytidylyltransferase MocA